MKLLNDIHIFLSKVKQNVIYFFDKYKYSNQVKPIILYRNKYKGRRCFIIGTGPSLTVEDLNLLKEEYSFGSNSIFRYLDKTDWRPTFYGCCDAKYYVENTDLVDGVIPTEMTFFPTDFGKRFGFKPSAIYYPRILPLNQYKKRFRTNAYTGLQEGSTITYFLMQLAAFMGFSEIYLLGIDFNYSLSVDNKGRIIKQDGVKDYAFNDKKAANYTMPNLEASYISYQSAQKYCEDNKHDVTIYNATRGGKLDVFTRVDLDKVLKTK